MGNSWVISTIDQVFKIAFDFYFMSILIVEYISVLEIIHRHSILYQPIQHSIHCHWRRRGIEIQHFDNTLDSVAYVILVQHLSNGF